MCRALPIPLVVVLVVGAAQAQERTAELSGQLRFVSEAPVEKIVGTADGARGQITTDPGDLTKTRGQIRVPVAQMKTGNGRRDAHLRGPVWLDAERFPEIVFDIESVVVKRDEMKGAVRAAQLEATGTFTLHGVSQPLTVPVLVKIKGDRVKVAPRFVVRLADYQVKGKRGVIGDKVGEAIEIEGALRGTLK